MKRSRKKQCKEIATNLIEKILDLAQENMPLDFEKMDDMIEFSDEIIKQIKKLL